MNRETEKLASNMDKGSGKAWNYHNHLDKSAIFKQGTKPQVLNKAHRRAWGKAQGIYLWFNGLQEGRYVHTNHQQDCRSCWAQLYKWYQYSRSNSEDGDPSICSTPTLGWRSQQFWKEELSEENWWNYQAWRHTWVKHEDVVLAGLGTVFRLCPCQDRVHTNFTTISTTSDSLTLFKLLKQDAYNLQSISYKQKNKAEWWFFCLLQDQNSDNTSFLDRFNNCVNVVEHCGGSMVDFEDIEKELEDLSLIRQMATNDQMKATKATAQDKLLGVAYLMCSDKHRFRKMVEHFNNAYLVGQDGYPKLVNDDYYCKCNWSKDKKT